MWEASWGIVAVLLIMLFVGLFASPNRGRFRVQPRGESEQIANPLEAMNRINQPGVESAASNTPYIQVVVQEGEASPRAKEAAKKKARGK
jgi:hypothetical protein